MYSIEAIDCYGKMIGILAQEKNESDLFDALALLLKNRYNKAFPTLVKAVRLVAMYNGRIVIDIAL